MKRLISTLLSVFAVIAAVQAQSRVEQLAIKSEILGAEKICSVYLPDGYDTSGENYPVLYLLHGAFGTHRSWWRTGGGELPRIAEEEIAAGRAPKMIVVMPDARGLAENKGGKNMGYFDVEGWPYETFFFQELIPYIDKNFRTIAVKEGRAIAGLSMGGGGSVVYAQRHSEVFNACYSTSGLLDHRYRYDDPARYGIEWLWSVAHNSPTEFVKNATPEELEKLRSVRWMMDCGDDDFLVDTNLRFFAEMNRAKVPVEFRIRDGVHDWKFWREALPEILRFSFKK